MSQAGLEALKARDPAPGVEEEQKASLAVDAARSALHAKALQLRIEQEAHRIFKVVDKATAAHEEAKTAVERWACEQLVARFKEALEEFASALLEAPIAPDEFEAHLGIFQQQQQALYSAAAQQEARASVVDEGAGMLAEVLQEEGAKLFKQNQTRFAEERDQKMTDVEERRREGPRFASLVDAVLSGNVLGVRFHLIDQKADGSAPDRDGNSPLHLACRGAHTEVVRCLLRHIMDCNVVDARGRTALHLCALNDAGGACHAIVIGGSANKALRDADGRTAESIAADLGHAEVAAMLHGSVSGPSKQAAVDYKEAVEQFLLATLGDGGISQVQRTVQIRELEQHEQALRTDEKRATDEQRYDDAEKLSQERTATSEKILQTRRCLATPSGPCCMCFTRVATGWSLQERCQVRSARKGAPRVGARSLSTGWVAPRLVRLVVRRGGPWCIHLHRTGLKLRREGARALPEGTATIV